MIMEKSDMQNNTEALTNNTFFLEKHHKDAFEKITKEKFLLFLLPIFLLAIIARLYGIDFGLPDLLHNDEPFEINRALRLASGSFDFRRSGKGGLYYTFL